MKRLGVLLTLVEAATGYERAAEQIQVRFSTAMYTHCFVSCWVHGVPTGCSLLILVAGLGYDGSSHICVALAIVSIGCVTFLLSLCRLKKVAYSDRLATQHQATVRDRFETEIMVTNDKFWLYRIMHDSKTFNNVFYALREDLIYATEFKIQEMISQTVFNAQLKDKDQHAD
ncbi:hypothetical protein Tco_0259978 [Tanacetum coccineum]